MEFVDSRKILKARIDRTKMNLVISQYHTDDFLDIEKISYFFFINSIVSLFFLLRCCSHVSSFAIHTNFIVTTFTRNFHSILA